MSIKKIILVIGLFANVQGVLAFQLDNNHQAAIEQLRRKNDREQSFLEFGSFIAGAVLSPFVPLPWSAGCLAFSLFLSSRFELLSTVDYSNTLLRNNDGSQNRVTENKAYLSNKLPHGFYYFSLGLCAGHSARTVVKR